MITGTKDKDPPSLFFSICKTGTIVAHPSRHTYSNRGDELEHTLHTRLSLVSTRFLFKMKILIVFTDDYKNVKECESV